MALLGPSRKRAGEAEEEKEGEEDEADAETAAMAPPTTGQQILISMPFRGARRPLASGERPTAEEGIKSDKFIVV